MCFHPCSFKWLKPEVRPRTCAGDGSSCGDDWADDIAATYGVVIGAVARDCVLNDDIVGILSGYSFSCTGVSGCNSIVLNKIVAGININADIASTAGVASDLAAGLFD